jgi:putative FmdB family regulatory protein
MATTARSGSRALNPVVGSRYRESAMATYEYLCLGCERPFEERRSMTDVRVETVLVCPACGSDRVRRRFSFSAMAGNGNGAAGRLDPAGGSGGSCCGGSCACGN